MNRTEYRKLSSAIRDLHGFVPSSYKGHPVIDSMRHIAWASDKLDHRLEMARYHGGLKALQMTVQR